MDNSASNIGTDVWRASFYAEYCRRIVNQWADEINFNYMAVESAQANSYTHFMHVPARVNCLRITDTGEDLHLNKYSGQKSIGELGWIFLRPGMPNRTEASDHGYAAGVVFRVKLRSVFPDSPLENQQYAAIKIVHKDIIEQMHFGDVLEEYIADMLQDEFVMPFWDTIKHLAPQEVAHSRAISLRKYKSRRKQRQLDLGSVTRGTDKHS